MPLDDAKRAAIKKCRLETETARVVSDTATKPARDEYLSKEAPLIAERAAAIAVITRVEDDLKALGIARNAAVAPHDKLLGEKFQAAAEALHAAGVSQEELADGQKEGL